MKLKAKIGSDAWSAQSLEDVQDILKEVQHSQATSWRPVGDRPNNIGTIRMGSDPALALVERVTNAMDDLLELGRSQNPSDSPKSPREAAQLWYQVPKTGLADMLNDPRRQLGERIRVILEESGDPKRPTVLVHDDGLGQSPSRFPKTLMSLNESNKVGMPWTMGTYGQGGSVTYGFSGATIVMSRRHPDFRGGEPDQIGWTIVIEQENDPELQVLPSYNYLVGEENEVLTFDPAELPGFEFGTRIKHIAYDLQGWTGPYTTGIWQFFHASLFDPVLPFLVSGTRKKEASYGSRIVIGNTARLNSPQNIKSDIEVAHKDGAEIALGPEFGVVTANYWVVRRPASSDKDSDPTAGYVQAGSAVSMTLFGQRQDYEPRTWIKDNAKYPFLYKNLIIQLDADRLTPRAKRELFASTRERATNSELRNFIYERLAEVLVKDDELKRLNHEAKERLLQKSTSASSDKIRKRLGQFIKNKLKDAVKPGKGGITPGDGGTKKHPPGPPSPPRPTDDTNLPNVPTKLVIKSKHMRAAQGGGTYTWVEIDAKNGYLPQHSDELQLDWVGDDPGVALRPTAKSNLLGGLTRWFFAASGDASIGTYNLRARLTTARGLLEDTAEIAVVAPPQAPPEKHGTEPETGPDVKWVTKEGWSERGWTERTVGEVTDDGEVVIWVNRHFQPLDKALSASHFTPEQIETRAERYLYPVACGLWLQQDAQKRAVTKPDEKYVAQELQRLAEAVLVAIDPDVNAAIEDAD